MKGGDAGANAAVIREILRGQPHPATNAVLLNAAAAIVIVKNRTPRDAFEEAEQALSSGKAAATLQTWRESQPTRDRPSQAPNMSLLQDILAEKRAEVARLGPPRERPSAWNIRDMRNALGRAEAEPLRLIGEIKFRSPSAGPLSTTLTAAGRARAYEDAGASMISVLTDQRWFDGS